MHIVRYKLHDVRYLPFLCENVLLEVFEEECWEKLRPELESERSSFARLESRSGFSTDIRGGEDLHNNVNTLVTAPLAVQSGIFITCSHNNSKDGVCCTAKYF